MDLKELKITGLKPILTNRKQHITISGQTSDNGPTVLISGSTALFDIH